MKTTLENNMIKDSEQLLGAFTQSPYKGAPRFPVKTYDNGFGPLWLLRDSIGIVGIVRAMTWEEAYEIAEDELFPKVSDEGQSSWLEEYGEEYYEDACWQEAYGFCPNGGFYEKDINGESLAPLTPELCEALNLHLKIKRPFCRVTKIEKEWTAEDLEAGESDSEPWVEEDSLELRDIIDKIKWAEPSCYPLSGDLSHVWATEAEQDFRTGNETETSWHLHKDATPREKRMWAWALRAANKKA
jgi:hypothetical protein